MIISNNISELVSITSKYSLVGNQEKYLDYLSRIGDYIISDPLEKVAFEKNVFDQCFFDRMGESYAQPISVSDSVKILRIAKSLSKILDYHSRHIVPAIILHLFPNDFKFGSDLVQVFNSVIYVLGIQNDAMVKIQNFFTDKEMVTDARSLYIQSSSLNLYQQLKSCSLIQQDKMLGNVRLIMIDNEGCFIQQTGKDDVFINDIKLIEHGVFVMKVSDRLIINNQIYSFEDIDKNSSKKFNIPNVSIAATDLSPQILFNAENSRLEIIGKSVPEDPFEFYMPLIEWLTNLLDSTPKTLRLIFQLEYFNTSSSKMILEIMRKAELLNENGCNVQIDWYYLYDDIDLLEAGETYSEIVEIPFNMLVREEKYKLN